MDRVGAPRAGVLGKLRAVIARQSGQSAIEYVGVTLVSAILVLTLAAAAPEIRTGITGALERAVCTLEGGGDCPSGDADDGEVKVLPAGEVDPEAPRPTLTEVESVGASGTLPGGATSGLATSDGSGAEDPCFAAVGSVPCAQEPGDTPTPGSGEGLYDIPDPPDIPDQVEPYLDICGIPLQPSQEAAADELASCAEQLEELLGRVPAGYDEAVRAAIARELGESGCNGFTFEATKECSPSERAHVADHVVEHLDQFSEVSGEYADVLSNLIFGIEEIPELQPPPPPDYECPSGFLAEAVLLSATCQVLQEDVAGGLFNAAINWPAAKPLKLLKEGGEALVKKLFKEESDEVAEQGVKEAGEQGGKEATEQLKRNKQAGDDVADDLAARYPDARREATLRTSDGPRRVDILTKDNVAIESKVGRVSNRSSTRRQYEKDAELLKKKEVRSVEWHFTRSSTTDKGGPTPALERALEKRGIKVVVE